jgi:hypothetical protein
MIAGVPEFAVPLFFASLRDAGMDLSWGKTKADSATSESPLRRAAPSSPQASRRTVVGASRSGTSPGFEPGDAGSIPAAPVLSGASSNGRTPGSDPGNRGSNPCAPSTLGLAPASSADSKPARARVGTSGARSILLALAFLALGCAAEAREPIPDALPAVEALEARLCDPAPAVEAMAGACDRVCFGAARRVEVHVSACAAHVSCECVRPNVGTRRVR